MDVYAPVITTDNQIVGIVRLSYRFATVYEDFIQLRYLIAAILIISLLVGVLIGSTLALNINSPLKKVIDAVYDLARGSRKAALAEQGPEEIRLLQRSVNHLMERLNNLEEARQRLLANLVHEIGRPLGALHAAVQALLRAREVLHLQRVRLAVEKFDIIEPEELLDRRRAVVLLRREIAGER